MDRETRYSRSLKNHILRSRFYKIFVATAAVVVFITTYMLILPAITLSAKCGIEEHTHTEECYKVSTDLICQLTEQQPHTHSAECYQTINELTCGMEEAHNESCYTENTKLICGQEETTGHTHTAECFKENKELICGKEEHKHTDSCYQDQSNPTADAEKLPKKFIFEDDEYIVTAVLSEEAELPEGAEFKVQRRDESSNEYIAAEARIKEFVETDDTVLAGMLLYDMHFELDGKEIEPNGSVQVTVQYKEAAELENAAALTTVEENSSDPTEEIKEELKVLHLVEDGKQITVEDVTQNIETDNNNAVTEAVFETTSFSDIAITKITTTSTTKGEWVKPGATVDFKGVLGDAIYYGMTLNTFNKTGHVDSTFATKVLNGSGDATTGAYTNDKAGAVWIGSMTGNLQIHGLPTEVYCPASLLKENGGGLELTSGAYNTPVSAETAVSYVEGLRQYCISQSEYLAAQPTTTLDRNIDFIQSKTIDLTKLGPGTYYLDGDRFFEQKYDLTIKMNGNQNIVFNFESKSPQITQFTAYIDGKRHDSADTSDTVEPLATRIIYNCPNATTLTQQGSFAGVVLAPYATYTIGSTSSGWIVCDTLSSDSGEWHFIYQELPEKIPVSLGFKATKHINNRTPEAGETFNFYLDQLVDGQWSNIQSKENAGSAISFDEITYNAEGTFWYRVYEDQTEKEGYELSTEQYIYKVVITGTTTSGKTVYKKAVTRYKLNPEQVLIVDGKINPDALIPITSDSEIVFNNYTKETTDIEVEKQWKHADGTDKDPETIPEDVTIEVDLYRITNGEGSGEKINETPIQLNRSNGWKYTAEGLKKREFIDGVEKTYTYYFVEKDGPEGYKTSYQAGDVTTEEAEKAAISEGCFEIVNKEKTKTSLTVNKKWFNSNGVDITNQTSGQISFDVYWKVTQDTPEEPDPGPEPDKNYSLNITNNWSGSSGIAHSGTYPAGTVVTFKFTETYPSNWGTGYSPNIQATLNGNAVNLNHYREYGSSSHINHYSVDLVMNEDKTMAISLDGPDCELEDVLVDGQSIFASKGRNALRSAPGPSAIPEGYEYLESGQIFAANGWIWSKEYALEDGQTASFYVIETTQDANVEMITYENQGTGSITINNKLVSKTYELPHTGGSGTRRITMLGLLLMAAAAGLMIVKKYRKEEI